MPLIPKNSNPFDEKGLVDLSKGFIPPIDVYEDGHNVIVETPLAGVNPKDVEVTVSDGVLIIQGKSEHRTEVDEKNYLYKEVRYGAFQRKVALPAAVLAERAEATSEHGMLKIAIPKDDKGGSKEVKVEIHQK